MDCTAAAIKITQKFELNKLTKSPSQRCISFQLPRFSSSCFLFQCRQFRNFRDCGTHLTAQTDMTPSTTGRFSASARSSPLLQGRPNVLCWQCIYSCNPLLYLSRGVIAHSASSAWKTVCCRTNFGWMILCRTLNSEAVLEQLIYRPQLRTKLRTNRGNVCFEWAGEFPEL